jgi:long-chain fatty acid transport protein
MNKIKMRMLSACCLLACSGVVSAAGFQVWEQNASGLSTAYAGSAAVAEDASTNFYNPAGLTRLPGLQLSAGVTGIRSHIRFNNEGSTIPGEGGNAGDTVMSPNAYLAMQLAPDWYVGFGISTPFALSTAYDAPWAGQAWAIKSEIDTINYNPSIAYRLSDKVSLGFGLNYQTIDLDFSSTTLNRFKADDSAWGWNAGALFTLSPAMRLGFSYRSAMDYRLEGTRTGVGAARADLKLPDTFTVSVWQQVSDRWEAMGDISHTNWSRLDHLDVQSAGAPVVEDYNYRDAWRFAWGAAYKASDAWKFKFGVAYERSPTTNSHRNARVPDADRAWVTFGGQWNAGTMGRFDLGYAYQYSRDVKIGQSLGGANLRGEYDNRRHVLGVQYSAGF